mmetsp:Transcript_3567/g.14854  ORF Transcript_3567/g.14854 Transcript_3567/m.14854 type:complete len:269 (+) Transcript_3567:458-1264(+)
MRLSSRRLTSRTPCASDSSACASLSLAFLGSMVLATESYLCMARTHMQRLLAALEVLATVSGSNSTSRMYLVILRMILGSMLSLSYVRSESRNFMSPSSFLASSQEGLAPSRMQTASITLATSAGGFAKDLTSWMSFLSRVSRALMELWYAGMASSRSRSQSSLMAFTLAATLEVSASSLAACAAAMSASFWSTASSLRSVSVSFFACASSGCILVSFTWSSATISFASAILRSPPSYREIFASTDTRCSASMEKYRRSSSRYDVGVV